jgi:hypothetical protein
LKPSAGTSTAKHEMRLWRGASGSVTAKTVISPATLPLVMNRFVPERW